MKRMKCAKKDFTEADLPLTRQQMFFDCYREQFSLILRLGLICLLILFPMLVVLLTRDMYLIGAIKGLEEETPEKLREIYASANVVFGALELLASVLFFVLFSGVAQILRQLCWGEPVFFSDDFKRGVRENAGRFAVIGFFLSLVRYLLGLLSGSAYFYLLFGIFAAIFLPLGLWILLQTLYYRLRWAQVIKNATFYLVRTFPMTVLLLVCTVVPFFLVSTFVTMLTVRYLLLVVLAVLYVVPLTMAWILYALQTFDENINKQHHPEVYRRGLRPIASDEKTENG